MNPNYCTGCMEHLDDNGLCPRCSYIPDEYKSKLYHLPVGTYLNNRYLVGRTIGEGGFGITYMGRDLFDDTKIAIKELYIKEYLCRDAVKFTEVSYSNNNDETLFLECQSEFEQEAHILSMLSQYDGTVGIKDCFKGNGTSYIVMEYLYGNDLKFYCQKKGKIHIRKIIEMLWPIFEVVKEIHKYGLIHRDISPDNIMICDDGKIKLIDFGTAKEFAEKDMEGSTVALKRGYAPIEQYGYVNQGPWTDIYAICATMYRAITGFTPQPSKDRCLQDKLVPPVFMSCNCPIEFSDVIMKGLSLQPENRYTDMKQFMDALEWAIENAPMSYY